MTSSIYPRPTPIGVPVGSIVITNPGTGFTSSVVVIDPPPSGITATGTPVIGATGVILTISALPSGTNYVDGEQVTGTGSISGSGVAGTIIAINGIVQSIAFTDRGTGFADGDTETVTLTGLTSTQMDATFTVTTIASTAIRSITIDISGSGYTAPPTVIITGDGSGATGVAVVARSAGNNIINSDIAITSDLVKPGGGGILRLYFSFTFTTSPGTIGVFNNSVLKGNLNADNGSVVIDDGYYRFDIDVESGDNINLQLKTGTGGNNVTGINFLRAHLVQFGA